ncbi:MAG: hypothetical protein AAF497_14205 [Planctomycetota bacterium]
MGNTEMGTLGIAFLLTEIVSVLQQADAVQKHVDKLNRSFKEYRLDGDDDLFVATLEELSQKYPQIVSRSADLQSRLNQLKRTAPR